MTSTSFFYITVREEKREREWDNQHPGLTTVQATHRTGMRESVRLWNGRENAEESTSGPGEGHRGS